MLKLYIHLGEAKTGSSSIQSFFNYNRNKLALEYGILYPNFNSQYFDRGMYHNHGLFFKSLTGSETDHDAVEKLIQLKEFCIRNNLRHVVLSWEAFGSTMMPESIKLIENILTCEIVLIVYLRRQDLLYESAWKQWGHKSRDYRNIQKFIKEEEMNLMNFMSIFERYLLLFSADNFIVKTFEKSSIGPDVVLDFLKIFDIHNKQGFTEPPDNNLNKNAGLAPELVEMMKSCNHLNKSINDNELIELMYNNLSDKYKKKDPFKPYGFLSIDERKQILEKYAPSNREVARMFFKDGRENLFLEPLEEFENHVLFQGLTVENTVPVFMELILNQYRKMESMKLFIQQMNQSDKNYISNDTTNTSVLTLDLKQHLFNSLMDHEISHKSIQTNGLMLNACGPDPWMVFKNPLENHLIHAVTISISVPVDTTIQIYFKTKECDFSEDNSYKKQIIAGHNTFKFNLPLLKQITQLRIDPGMHPGQYIMHEVLIEYTFKS